MAKVIEELGAALEDAPVKRDKQPLQLTWTDITIKAMPATGRCKPQGALKQERTILDKVSGTVMPGQFLAIIGASGKILNSLIRCRCRQDYPP